MILQLGTLLGGLFQNVVQPLFQAALPLAQQVGSQFLQRELGRREARRQRDFLKSQAVQALNTPGISVGTLGGTIQPVGGRVQRPTFTSAAFTPAQLPFGNVPLPPFPLGSTFPLDPFSFRQPVQQMVRAVAPQLPALTGAQLPVPIGQVAPGAPRFASDQFGKTIMFVPSPRPGEGFLPVLQARQLGLKPQKPFWRFNRALGQFEKVKSRRLNPFNFKAAARAGRRIERTLEAVKNVVVIQKKMEKGDISGGKVVKFRTKKRKK